MMKTNNSSGLLNTYLHYLFPSFHLILSFIVACFVVKGLATDEQPATKQELIEIIEATPCAYKPIGEAVEQNPISFGRANALAIKCQRDILSNAGISNAGINEQKEALKFFAKDK
ncbi:hypothetical protein [Pluralibacter gergoviae]|uniref:hypothetical protein n=1 Tax=Enterobacteriaceae TaxID=543 RepID=UPI0029F34C88|nr:hypothetical protein [Klebsiella pneumoniae]HDH0204904.1 hypothetical protein [Klebsiella pneumoniae]HEJ8439645.1 hypothetical protein [Klebsiella oxytoca]